MRSNQQAVGGEERCPLVAIAEWLHPGEACEQVRRLGKVVIFFSSDAVFDQGRDCLGIRDRRLVSAQWGTHRCGGVFVAQFAGVHGGGHGQLCINALYEVQVNRAVGIVIVAGVISGLPQIEQKVVVGLGDEDVGLTRVEELLGGCESGLEPVERAYNNLASCLAISGSLSSPSIYASVRFSHAVRSLRLVSTRWRQD